MTLCEETAVHTRLLKCALEVDEARSYWREVEPGTDPSPQAAFEAYWFGAKSLPRVKVLLTNFRARFNSYPDALRVLHAWRTMEPSTRALVCHWHLQLSDPLYRAFTGDYLVARRDEGRADVTRDLVVAWVGDQGPGRWTMGTRVQFASKLLSAAHGAGLVTTRRDPRPIGLPRVDDDALSYILYLLRGVTFAGTLLDNPYLRSVGLTDGFLDDRLRALSTLAFRKQGGVVEMGWAHRHLVGWACSMGILTPEGSAA